MRLLLLLICLNAYAKPPATTPKKTPAGKGEDCGFEQLTGSGEDLTDNQAVFNSDVYGGKAYERGVMAYGSKEKGGGWWSIQKQIQATVEKELKRKQQAAGSSAETVKVLDIGSGPGFTLNEINRLAAECCRGLKVETSGVEYNDKMVAYSREEYGVNVRQGDMHALSSYYPAQSLDIINAQSVLWASNKPLKVASEIAKVQKPGGIATFTWPVRRSTKNGHDNYDSWFSAFKKSLDESVAEKRISREQADGVLEAHRQLVLGNKVNSPRDPAEVIELFTKQGYVLEEKIPQYPGEHGEPIFYQYVFRKK